RLAMYQLPVEAPSPAPELPLKPLASLLRIQDAALRSLLNDWLAGVYVCNDVAQAFALRPRLEPGHTLVVAQGHLVDRHGIRFYAPDSEQAGMLARQGDIKNLQRDI